MKEWFGAFPRASYQFGSTAGLFNFTQLTAYIDIIDQLKDQVSYYQPYVIGPNDRPDNVAFELYGRPYYHWTFFLLNDKLRQRGWPVSDQKVFTLATQYWPHITVNTEQTIHDRFTIGTSVLGVSSGVTGTVIHRRLDYGQIIIEADTPFQAGELLQDTSTLETITVLSSVYQYNSTRSYTNSEGYRIEIDPFNQTLEPTVTQQTYYEYLSSLNADQRRISVLKREVVDQVAGELVALLRQ